jgi:Exostosin family
VLHGCIPVLIQDRVEEKFSNVVDYTAFALRIAEADIEQVRFR